MSIETSPAAVPDVLGMKLAHRVMLKDLARTTAVAEGIAAGEVRPTRRRLVALGRYLHLMADSIHHHHVVEDDILWPVIQQRAGAHIDLTALSDDHEALDPHLDGIRAATDELLRAPAARDAAATLAARLAAVRDLVTEHIAEEERDTFGVIERYLSVADWQGVENRIRKSGGTLSFEAPRVAAACTPAELAKLKAEAGVVIVVLLAVLTPRYRRLERAIWG